MTSWRLLKMEAKMDLDLFYQLELGQPWPLKSPDCINISPESQPSDSHSFNLHVSHQSPVFSFPSLSLLLGYHFQTFSHRLSYGLHPVSLTIHCSFLFPPWLTFISQVCHPRFLQTANLMCWGCERERRLCQQMSLSDISRDVTGGKWWI